jgi:D-specific alpha-keto acid dehydrogenase
VSRPSVGLTVYGCEPDEAALFEQLGPRVGVVPAVTTQAVSDAPFVSTIVDRCISVDHRTAVGARTLRTLRRSGVEHVSTRSIGLDHIDLDAARALGITVENVVYEPDGVADHTVMVILMSIRDVIGTIDAARRHDFRLPPRRGRDLRDVTVGVVGAGHIGSAVIRRLQAFGGRVLACSATRPPAAVEQVALDTLLRDSDVVTLHVPLTAETHHLLGVDRLALMKRGALVINTGRGALVDTDALLEALRAGRLGGAALDVLEGEAGIFYLDRRARPPEHQALRELLSLPNVIVTPHTAFHTERALHDTVEGALLRCREFERRRADVETEGRDRVRRVL